MATETILDLPVVTDIQETDVIYFIRGAGAGRDKQALANVIIPVTLSPSTTSAIDLSLYKTDLILLCSNTITLTLNNNLPSGKRLCVVNIGVGIVTLAGAIVIALSSGSSKTWITDGASFFATAVGTGSTVPNPIFLAGQFYYPTANLAPLNTRVLTNGKQKEHLHSDTTDESITGFFDVPGDIDPAGTVTFIVICSPVTAVASKNIAYDFQHSAVPADTDIDLAYTVEASGDLALSSVQDALNRLTFMETVANLGWAANEFCRFILNRHNAGVTNNLGGDHATWSLEVDIPRI